MMVAVSYAHHWRHSEKQLGMARLQSRQRKHVEKFDDSAAIPHKSDDENLSSPLKSEDGFLNKLWKRYACECHTIKVTNTWNRSGAGGGIKISAWEFYSMVLLTKILINERI
jgi:hypothetical protein